jgi:hypothetical protein
MERPFLNSAYINDVNEYPWRYVYLRKLLYSLKILEKGATVCGFSFHIY